MQALRLDTDWFGTFGAAFFEAGPETRDILLDGIPDDFRWEGSRVMDFGCGMGRTLVHFQEEAKVAEIWGVDVDKDALAPFEENLCPPMHAHMSNVDPPLPFEDSSFDLIWAISVWTHLTDNALPWLAEMHRILKPGGLSIPTYMGESHSEPLAGESWDEDRVGMNAAPLPGLGPRGADGADLRLVDAGALGPRVRGSRHQPRAASVQLAAAAQAGRAGDGRGPRTPERRSAGAGGRRHNLRQVQRELEMALSEGEEHTRPSASATGRRATNSRTR